MEKISKFMKTKANNPMLTQKEAAKQSLLMLGLNDNREK